MNTPTASLPPQSLGASVPFVARTRRARSPGTKLKAWHWLLIAIASVGGLAALATLSRAFLKRRRDPADTDKQRRFARRRQGEGEENNHNNPQPLPHPPAPPILAQPPLVHQQTRPPPRDPNDYAWLDQAAFYPPPREPQLSSLEFARDVLEEKQTRDSLRAMHQQQQQQRLLLHHHQQQQEQQRHEEQYWRQQQQWQLQQQQQPLQQQQQQQPQQSSETGFGTIISSPPYQDRSSSQHSLAPTTSPGSSNAHRDLRAPYTSPDTSPPRAPTMERKHSASSERSRWTPKLSPVAEHGLDSSPPRDERDDRYDQHYEVQQRNRAQLPQTPPHSRHHRTSAHTRSPSYHAHDGRPRDNTDPADIERLAERFYNASGIAPHGKLMLNRTELESTPASRHADDDDDQDDQGQVRDRDRDPQPGNYMQRAGDDANGGGFKEQRHTLLPVDDWNPPREFGFPVVLPMQNGGADALGPVSGTLAAANSAPASSSSSSSSSSSPPTPTEFTLVSYNVRIDKDKMPHTWRNRAPHVLANIRGTGASVVCLQESSSPVLRDLKQGLGPQWIHCGVRRSQRGRQDEAVHVLVDTSVFTVLGTATYLLTQSAVGFPGFKGPILCNDAGCTGTTEFDGVKDRHPRIFTYVRLRHNATGRVFDLINTHFSLVASIQAASAEQLVSFVQAERLGQDVPLVVTGDFNAKYAPGTPGTPVQRLMEALNLQDTLNLRDIPTYGGSMAGPVDPAEHRLDYTLQRGFVTTAAHVKSYVIPGTAASRPSDHDAVVNTLKFP